MGILNGTIEGSNTISGSLTTAAQANITSVGTLTSLGVTNAVTATRFVGILNGVVQGSNTVSASNILVASGSPASIVIGSNAFVFSNAAGLANVMIMSSAGQVGIGTAVPAYTLDVTGTIRCSGDVIAYSDARLKTQVEPIRDALNKLEQINGYTFQFSSGNSNRQAGVIAQEIQKVLPEVVYSDGEGNLSVAYGNIVSLLIEALKEETKKRKSLETRIDVLEKNFLLL